MVLFTCGFLLANVGLFAQEPTTALEVNAVETTQVPSNETASPEPPTLPSPIETSLVARIDALLAEGNVVGGQNDVNPLGLLRRLYLDLLGIPPTLDEIDAFLAKPAETRYAEEVANVIQRPEFIEHWVDQFDVFLMERRANTNIPQDQWREWLRVKIATEIPIHQWMSELITADGLPGPNRPAARFLLDRDTDPHLITRDIGRLYFGVDLQCAQCHDHPSIDSYFQTDYHGLLGFVASVSAVEFQDGDTKIKIVAEKAANEAPFESVFDRGKARRVLPHVPFAAELPQPWLEPGDEYHSPTADGGPAVPKGSRRSQLADLVKSGELSSFNEAIANRLWSLVFGRGAIHPVDFVHGESAPRHMSLANELAKGLAEKNFQLKPFVQTLVLTETYQRQGLPLRYEAESLGEEAMLSNRWLVPGGSRPDWLGELSQRAQERQHELESQVELLRMRVEESEKGLESALQSIAAVHAERVTGLATVDVARAAITQSLDARGKKDTEHQAAVGVLDATKDKLAKFQAALDATNAALATVGEDTAVAEARKVLEQRVGESVAAVGPAEQNVQKLASELSAIDQQLMQQRESLATARSAADLIHERWRPLEQKVAEARKTHLFATQGLASVRREISLMQAWVDCDHAFQGLEALKTQIATATQTLDAIEKLETTLVTTGGANTEADSTDRAIRSRETWKGVSGQLADAILEIESAKSRLEEVRTKLVEHRAIAESQIQNQTETLARLEQLSGEHFSSTMLVPLTPIQVGWSSLVSTGVFKNYVAKHLGELEKEAPATSEQAADPVFLQARGLEAWTRARKELTGSISPFINLYAAAPGQPQGEFFATADQALFARNGGTLFAWSGPSGDNVTSRVIAAPDARTAAVLLYRGILTREPTENEIAEVGAYLGQAPDARPRLVQEMVWGLLASAEFRFRP